MESRRCPEVDRRRALGILYQQIPQPHRDEQIDRLLDGTSSLSLDGLIACYDAGMLVGTMLTLPATGRVLMAWPPRVVAKGSTAETQAQESLLGECLAEGRRQNARFVQLLAEEIDDALVACLATRGFLHLTKLVYVRRPTIAPEVIPALSPDTELVAYSETLHETFLDVLAKSYEGSLDCPELTGIRTMQDIFESHRGTRALDAKNWLLVRRAGRWAGCLILSPAGDGRLLEISYVAVLPTARGEGLGRVLTREAIRRAVDGGCEAVVLAVDARNEPALAMYEDEGFVPWDLRDIYLAVLEPADGRLDRSRSS